MQHQADHCAHVARYHLLRYWSWDLVPRTRQRAREARDLWTRALMAAYDEREARAWAA